MSEDFQKICISSVVSIMPILYFVNNKYNPTHTHTHMYVLYIYTCTHWIDHVSGTLKYKSSHANSLQDVV